MDQEVEKPVNPLTIGRELISYSSISMFRNCRKQAEFRYVRKITSSEPKARPLRFGSLFHEALKLFYRMLMETGNREGALNLAILFIEDSTPAFEYDQEQRVDRIKARVMMREYVRHYDGEDFQPISVEDWLECPIVCPDTDTIDPGYYFGGRLDLISNDPFNGLVIGDHKTTARIDGNYIEKLTLDLQGSLYKSLVERSGKAENVAGVVFNLIQKPASQMQPKKGETEEEYAERLAELQANSKTGKPSKAKRKLPETDQEFEDRVTELYRDPSRMMFHRELILFTEADQDLFQRELWALVRSFDESKQKDFFYRNTAFCHHYGRSCEYLPICRSNGNEALIGAMYHQIGEKGSDMIDDLSGDFGFMDDTSEF